LKEGICEVKKKIYVGQEIRIKILDDAGNSWVDSFVAWLGKIKFNITIFIYEVFWLLKWKE